MNVMLDTTYLMPAIGITVGGVRPDVLRTLRGMGHAVSISELTLSELGAEGAMYASSGRLSRERLLMGRRATVLDESLRKVLFYAGEQLTVSFGLRKIMNDYVDCAILSSALCGFDALMTEDGIIHSLVYGRELRGIVDEVNPSEW